MAANYFLRGSFLLVFQITFNYKENGNKVELKKSEAWIIYFERITAAILNCKTLVIYVALRNMQFLDFLNNWVMERKWSAGGVWCYVTTLSCWKAPLPSQMWSTDIPMHHHLARQAPPIVPIKDRRDDSPPNLPNLLKVQCDTPPQLSPSKNFV